MHIPPQQKVRKDVWTEVEVGSFEPRGEVMSVIGESDPRGGLGREESRDPRP